MRELVPPRAPDSHKGDYGRVLDRRRLASARPARRTWPRMGALRSGAGLVTVATPRSCLPIIAAMAPEYMTEPLV